MKISRRAFLGTAGATMAGPLIIVGQDRPAASERITMGLIGCGGQGMGNIGNFMRQADCQVVAACDVDAGRLSGAKATIEKHYANETKNGTYKGCETYRDFRELCARKDINAVVIGSADHWHALTALEAIRNGKDVYGEKPIVHLWAEGRLLADEVKKHNRIWQTGSQQRSESNFHRAVELVLNGKIGKIQHVEVGLPPGAMKAKGEIAPVDPPANFDYDFWCGPSKKVPFIPARTHYNWRWYLQFGGGQLMDWIGHHNDIAHWGLNRDNDGPVEVEAVGFEFPEDKTVIDAPHTYDVRCKYADGVTSSISSKNPMGTKWTGADGWIYVNRGKLDASSKEWLDKNFDAGPVKAYKSPGHHRNFTDCVKSRKPTICPAETSFRSITPGLLGYVANSVGKKLKWDPKAEKILDNPEADKLLKTVEYRAPWKFA